MRIPSFRNEHCFMSQIWRNLNTMTTIMPLLSDLEFANYVSLISPEVFIISWFPLMNSSQQNLISLDVLKQFKSCSLCMKWHKVHNVVKCSLSWNEPFHVIVSGNLSTVRRESLWKLHKDTKSYSFKMLKGIWFCRHALRCLLPSVIFSPICIYLERREKTFLRSNGGKTYTIVSYENLS